MVQRTTLCRHAKEVRSDKIRVVQQANQGVSAARNKGIELAAGEYICFLDADDTWHPDYLQNIETIVQKYPQSDIFVTAYRIIYANGRCKESRRLPQTNGCLPSYWETLGKGYDFVWTSATTVRRTALLAAGEFRLGEKIGQDLDLWARLARNNPCVAYASRVCVDYKPWGRSQRQNTGKSGPRQGIYAGFGRGTEKSEP